MIVNIWISLLEALIGFAAGIAVGGGLVAFLTLLGVIPRLIQLSKSDAFIKSYIASVIIGSLFGIYMSFADITWNQPVVLLIMWGLFHGVFNGMLAAALTEVLNVFPILSKRIRMEDKLLWFLWQLYSGKWRDRFFNGLYL